MPLPIRHTGELDDLPPFYRAIYDGQMESHGVKGEVRPDTHWQEIRASPTA